MLTKDRIGAGVAAVAAVVGLVLVFTYHQSTGSNTGGNDNTAPTSQIATPPGAPSGATVPSGRAPGPAPTQAQPRSGDSDG